MGVGGDLFWLGGDGRGSVGMNVDGSTVQVLIVEFLQIPIPTDRTSGIRTLATQMLINKFVEICSTPLRPGKIIYSFPITFFSCTCY